MSDRDIAELLIESRQNNIRDQLTGALLYHNGRFLQVLEGPEDVVVERIDAIFRDERHRGAQTVLARDIAHRQFPEWTMGFRPVGEKWVTGLEGFDDFFDARTGRARIQHAENEAQQFLEWMRDYWFGS